jgi:hypothetical protein
VSSSSRKLWDRLIGDGIESSGYVRLRFPEVTACPAYAARHLESGLEAIVLEVRKNDLPLRQDLPSTNGFSVQVQALDPGRGGRSRLIVALSDRRYSDVFEALADDLIGQLSASTDSVGAVSTLFERLARWQRFLEAHRPDGLSLSERRGLYGELVILRKLLGGGIDPLTALESWTGPRMAIQDFQIAEGSIEVKTSGAVVPGSVKITNVKQLDDSGLRFLLLTLVLVDERPQGTTTLPNSITEIQALLPENTHNLWEERLRAAGYLKSQEHRYHQPAYLIREVRHFQVGPGFPRLLGSDLPPGVLDVSYSVDLAMLQGFEIQEKEALSMLEAVDE